MDGQDANQLAKVDLFRDENTVAGIGLHDRTITIPVEVSWGASHSSRIADESDWVALFDVIGPGDIDRCNRNKTDTKRVLQVTVRIIPPSEFKFKYFKII